MPAIVAFVTSTHTWSVMQEKANGEMWHGEWAGFSDQAVANNFAGWLNETFDTDGIIARLHGSGNTPQDLEAIRYIIRRAKHVTAVPDIYPETIAAKFHRERGTPDWE